MASARGGEGPRCYSARVLFRATRARARTSLSLALVRPSFFVVCRFFCACFTPPLPTFSPFLVDAGLLGNYQSGSSDRKYPAHPPPFATCVPAAPAVHLSFLPPLPSSPGPGISAAAAAAIRSLTNLFDKSPRLIGLTTRLFFPSVKFTVVTKSLVVPPALSRTLRPLPFKFLRRHLAAFSFLSFSSFLPLDFRDISRDS